MKGLSVAGALSHYAGTCYIGAIYWIHRPSKRFEGSSQNSVDSALIGPQDVIRFSVIYIN